MSGQVANAVVNQRELVLAQAVFDEGQAELVDSHLSIL